MKVVFCMILYGLACISCSRYEFKELSPSWIKVDQITLSASGGLTNGHAIQDVWVFIDDAYTGTFSIPALIPVLNQGIHRISFYPGIRNYGIIAKPEIYTLISTFTVEVDLLPDKTNSINPAFKYSSNLRSYLQEGFESTSVFIHDLDSFKQSTLVRSKVNARDGIYAGYGLLTPDHPLIEVATHMIEITPAAKKTSYLEMDVISDTEVQLGLITAQGAKTYFLTLRPALTWKKIYIPLYEIIQTNESLNNASAYQLVIKSELKPASSAAYFFIDNLRWISLP